MPAIDLAAVVSYLDRYLRTSELPDAPNALNGLQLANGGTISRVTAAGLFWGGLQPLTGRAYRRVAGLTRHNIALYSAHLPLDVHPEVGNNAVLAHRLGVARRGEFGEEYGMRIGVWGEVDIPRAVLAQRVGEVVGGHPRLMAFGPERVRRVGIVTGAAGSMIGQAAAQGLDTYITGEGAHHTFFDAEELGLNVFYAGHYATETFGVKALAERLCAEFDLPWTFLDHPTDL